MKNIVFVLFFILVLLPLCAEQCSQTVKCAVDAKPINKSEARITYEYNGKIYYFCSGQCKEKFIKEPEKYIKSDCSNSQQKPVIETKEHNEPPYVCRRAELIVENIPQGVIIKITSNDPQKVKEIQEFARKMVEQREAHQKGENK